MHTINGPRNAALASVAASLKKHGYGCCVRADGKPCHCAKLVAGTLHCGPTRVRTVRTKEEARNCERSTAPLPAH